MCHFAGCAGCGDDWGDDWGGDEVGVADFFFFLFLLDVEREERASGEAVFACDFDCLLLLFVVSADGMPVRCRLLGGVSVGDGDSAPQGPLRVEFERSSEELLAREPTESKLVGHADGMIV